MKRSEQCNSKGRGKGRPRKILKTETETETESDDDYAPSSLKYIVTESSGYAIRSRQIGDNQGNQDEEAPVQNQNHSSPCGEKSNNNNNTALESSMSPESLSKQDMEREQASKFHSAEFIQNHLLRNGTTSCGEPKRREEGGGARSFNFTEVASMMNQCSREVDDDEIESSMHSGSVNVKGYFVKKEVATLFEKIIKTHGDIGKNCEIKCRESRGLFVEMMCSVYKKLEDISLKKITEIEIDGMLSTVDFLQKAKFDVEWLYQRLHDISRIKNLCKDYADLKKEEGKKKELIVEKEREIDWYKEKLANLEAEVVVLKSESDKVERETKSLMKKGFDFWKKSLVHGLV